MIVFSARYRRSAICRFVSPSASSSRTWRSCAAEPGDPFVLARPGADPFEDPGGHGRVEQALAGGDPAHGVDQLGRADLLEDVSGGAGHDGVEQRLVVGERREDEARRAGMQRADLPAGLDAVAVLEAHVEDRHVGIEGVDPADGLLLGRRLTDHPDVVLGFEQVGHAAPDDLVIVEEEHRDLLAHPVILPARAPADPVDHR